MWQRFTERARKVVFYAQEEAQKHSHGFVQAEHLLLGCLRDGTEHLLLGIIRHNDGFTQTTLAKFGVELEAARAVTRELQAAKPQSDEKPKSKPYTGGGMWQRFTERARKAVFYAQEEAQIHGEGYVSTEHLLLGLLRENDSVCHKALKQIGIEPEAVRADLKKMLPTGDEWPSQDMTLTPRAKRVIDLAYDESRNLNNNYIGTEHLLLGIIREADGMGGRVLEKFGARTENTRQAVIELQKSEKVTPSIHDPGLFSAPPARSTHMSMPAQAQLAIRQEIAVPEFVFLFAVSNPDGAASRALREVGVNVNALQTIFEVQLMRKDQRTCDFTLDQILTAASELAADAQKPFSSAFLILALLSLKAEPITALLEEVGVDAVQFGLHLRKSL